MTVEGPRRDKAALNAIRIQAEISEILKTKPEGAHFNEVFRLLNGRKILNNNSILVSNLKQLMLKGLVKKTQLPGKGFGTTVYLWTGRDKESDANESIDISFSQWLPYVYSSRSEGGELRSIHVTKGHEKDFKNAVSLFNSIGAYFRPTVEGISEGEKRFLLGFMENTGKLLQIQSSLLREDKPVEENASWKIFLAIVMKNFEALFDDFAKCVSNQNKDKMTSDAFAFRKKLNEIFRAMVMQKAIELDGIRIH